MMEIKSIEKPDERRDFPRGHLEVVNMSGLVFGKATFEPGWRWTESVRDIAGTELLVIDEDTTVRGFQKELRWNQAYYRLAQGL